MTTNLWVGSGDSNDLVLELLVSVCKQHRLNKQLVSNKVRMKESTCQADSDSFGSLKVIHFRFINAGVCFAESVQQLPSSWPCSPDEQHETNWQFYLPICVHREIRLVLNTSVIA